MHAVIAEKRMLTEQHDPKLSFRGSSVIDYKSRQMMSKCKEKTISAIDLSEAVGLARLWTDNEFNPLSSLVSHSINYLVVIRVVRVIFAQIGPACRHRSIFARMTDRPSRLLDVRKKRG